MIHTIEARTTFVRIGSNSLPTLEKIPFSKQNIETVISIENNSRNSIAHTLDGVLDFITVRHKNRYTEHHVFKELFVVCWSGNKKKIRDTLYFSRVDIELINEQIKLFYSAQDEVTIAYTDSSFIITEYISLGLNDKTSYYPLEKVTITFFDNGYYKMENKMLFEPPQFNKKMLHHIYNSNNSLLEKIKKNTTISDRELIDLHNVPYTFMICYLNGFHDAKALLIEAKPFLKLYPQVYLSFKEAMRVLRKMKYNN
jgi:DNA modification methylase